MFLDVSLMYFVCILTLPEQCAWRCGDTRIYLCTHNTPQLVGYVLNAPQILDRNTYEYIQIHVSSRYSWGVYSTHFRGKTQPSPCWSPKPTQEHGVLAMMKAPLRPGTRPVGLTTTYLLCAVDSCCDSVPADSLWMLVLRTSELGCRGRGTYALTL